MRTVTLGRSDLKVSEICLGTMTWGTQNSEAEGHSQMDQALAAGVNFLDTAEMYPVNPVRAETIGRTEEIIGSWNRRTGRRGDWIIATKITGEDGKARGDEPISGDAVGRALEGSLKRLATDYVDLYQLHWPNRDVYHFRAGWHFDPRSHDKAAILAHMEDVLQALDRAMTAGKIRHWGLSNETCWGTAMWLQLADRMGVARPLTHQNEYSLLCRLWDLDLAELSHNEGMALLAFSPVATGLLTGKYQGDVIPPGSRRSLNPTLSGRVTERVWGAVEAYLAIARAAGLDPAAMAVAWTMTRPVQTLPIIGATTPGQLAIALSAAELRLPPEVLAAIEGAHKAHPWPY
ncbi:aldo/keto reductase [Frigidibacter sp. RF13]|uniref:aldo/keto reductase n=1 Tax=Frigidibacter sp. RF13 TaxID=2997340 RepID=UPI002270AF0E|nr:aldo/keto reductase [Frigidibacter sp. RF13]MCY1128038.1 aldo/keto reductase [Frigidibacter sp. RF13]